MFVFENARQACLFALQEAGVNDTEVAAALGVSRPSWSRFKKSTGNWDDIKIRKISELTGFEFVLNPYEVRLNRIRV